LLLAVKEVFGSAHLPSQLLGRQMCGARVFAKFAWEKLRVGECCRDGANVEFCSATTEVIRVPPFELALKLWRPQKRKLFVGRFCETPFEGGV
jgi:hypothetical protein